MEYMNKIKDMICKELKVYGEKTKLSGAALDVIWKITDTIKNIAKINILSEDGHSEARGYSMAYDDDDMMYSERRGRGRYARRDRMGRYSSDDGSSYEGSSYDDYSEDGRYSRHGVKDHMMNKLGEMMEGANSKEREALKECMRALEKA